MSSPDTAGLPAHQQHYKVWLKGCSGGARRERVQAVMSGVAQH